MSDFIRDIIPLNILEDLFLRLLSKIRERGTKATLRKRGVAMKGRSMGFLNLGEPDYYSEAKPAVSTQAVALKSLRTSALYIQIEQ